MRSRSVRSVSLLSYVLLLVLTVAACTRAPEPGAADDPPPASDAETELPAGETPPDMAPRDADTDGPDANGADTTDAKPTPALASAPTLTTFREDDGATASLTFRSEEGVAVSADAPLLLVIDGDTLAAPLTAGPARFTEPGGSVVDQASYRLDAEAFRALFDARTDAVTVRVSHGDGYQSYPYLSGDTIE